MSDLNSQALQPFTLWLKSGLSFHRYRASLAKEWGYLLLVASVLFVLGVAPDVTAGPSPSGPQTSAPWSLSCEASTHASKEPVANHCPLGWDIGSSEAYKHFVQGLHGKYPRFPWKEESTTVQ